MTKTEAPIVKVWWCHRCNGGDLTEQLCPKCQKPALDMGWRKGWGRHDYQYFSHAPIPVRQS